MLSWSDLYEILKLHVLTIVLIYRNDDDTFIIPAKLPEGTEEITWTEDPAFTKYIGRRVECRDASDMFSIDTFPCLQVSAMNRYREKHVKPKLSHSAVKVCGKVEGMIQLTKNKRAIHIAVRLTEGQEHLGIEQINQMEEMVFEQILERSRGIKVTVSYLSPRDLQKSNNLEDNVSFYADEAVKQACEHGTDLKNPVTLVPESVESVTLIQNPRGAGNLNQSYLISISYCMGNIL